MSLGIRLGLQMSAGSPLFSPVDLGGCVLWLDANTGAAANGSSWADQSGTGDANKDAVQADPAMRPTHNAVDADFNGNASYSFATTSVLVSGVWSVALAQPATWFLVGKAGSAAAYRTAFDGADGDHRHQVIKIITTDICAFVAGGDAVESGVNIGSNPVIVATEFNGASSKQYINSLTAAVTGDGGPDDLTQLRIGQHSAAHETYAWGGKIATLIAYNSVLSAPNRALVMGYLSNRYGIALS